MSSKRSFAALVVATGVATLSVSPALASSEVDAKPEDETLGLVAVYESGDKLWGLRPNASKPVRLTLPALASDAVASTRYHLGTDGQHIAYWTQDASGKLNGVAELTVSDSSVKSHKLAAGSATGGKVAWSKGLITFSVKKAARTQDLAWDPVTKTIIPVVDSGEVVSTTGAGILSQSRGGQAAITMLTRPGDPAPRTFPGAEGVSSLTADEVGLRVAGVRNADKRIVWSKSAWHTQKLEFKPASESVADEVIGWRDGVGKIVFRHGEDVSAVELTSGKVEHLLQLPRGATKATWAPSVLNALPEQLEDAALEETAAALEAQEPKSQGSPLPKLVGLGAAILVGFALLAAALRLRKREPKLSPQETPETETSTPGDIPPTGMLLAPPPGMLLTPGLLTPPTQQ